MARSFTEREKNNIRRNLREICKRYWTQYGYKKTSVDDLCKQAGISKGAAVETLCRLLDIPVTASVAAGDERNDLAMLRAAGIGAAPRNAHPQAKEAADYLCEKDHNAGAVGEIIDRFF